MDFSLGVSGTYYTTKATKRDENYQYDYQNRAGKPIDAVFDWKVWIFLRPGRYCKQPDTEIYRSGFGDIKYKRSKRWRVIDQKDAVYLGKGGWYGLPFTMGVNFTAKWKNFTLFALGTGGWVLMLWKTTPISGYMATENTLEVVRGRWTEATKETAVYPRLTTQSGDNNFRNSDFWMYKNDRFNPAKIQLTYDFPKSMLQNSFIHEVSAYVSGSNLLTLSKEREILEMSVGSAPRHVFYNVGLKVAF